MRLGLTSWSRLTTLVVLVLLSGCSSAPSSAPPSDRHAARATTGVSCRLTALLVPTCGALLGMTAPEPTYRSLRGAERALGAKVRMVYRFHDIDDTIPDREDRAIVRSGRLLRLTIESRSYASSDRSSVTWSDVAAGRYDRQLMAQARGIRAMGRPVLLTFSHEPDQRSRSSLGTSKDYVDAWRHVHELFARQGVRRAVWVWTVTAWPQAYDRALSMWPGNDYVDWISWEAYNKAGCTRGNFKSHRWTTFEQAAVPFYRYLWRHGPPRGIDAHKPMMLSEVGSVSDPDDPDAAARWYLDIPRVLKHFPQIKAVSLWNHTGSAQGCDFQFARDPKVIAAVSQLQRDPYLTKGTGR